MPVPDEGTRGSRRQIRIDFQRAGTQRRSRDGTMGPANHCSKTGEQLADVVRLGQVVIRATVETGNTGLDGV